MAAFDFAATLRDGMRTMLDTLGVGIRYRPVSGSPIECQGMFEQPDMNIPSVAGGKLRDRRQILRVLQADIPAAPAAGDVVEVPKGAAARRVLTASTPPDDGYRIFWLVELAD